MRNAARHTMTNVDIQMAPLGASGTGSAGFLHYTGSWISGFVTRIVGELSRPSNTRNWHSNRFWPCSSAGRHGLVRKISLWTVLLLESPILYDLLYSTQTGSRCLNCLRNFVKASKSSPPSVWCLLQLNVLKNVYNTCQQQQMSC